MIDLRHGDSREVLKTLADNSIDSVLTDPPYALVSIAKRLGPGAKPIVHGTDGAYARAAAGFMGKTWDTGETAFSVDFWAEVFRVLKPGGHVLAFGGTRTYHRLAVAIEDAGFEIRDMVAWLYGSGFPKSHDVSKGIAKRRTEDVEPVRVICRVIRAAMDAKGLKSRDLTRHFGDCHSRMVDHWAARDTDSQPNLPTWGQWLILKRELAITDEHDAEVWRLNGRKGTPGAGWSEAAITGEHEGSAPGLAGMRFSEQDRTIRKVEGEAAQWAGWGTALKPALEPICLARKPLEGTVAANVLKWGTGALNIDGCRVDLGGAENPSVARRASAPPVNNVWKDERSPESYAAARPGEQIGRWPANVVHDGSDEVVEAFPADRPGFGSGGRREGLAVDRGSMAGPLGNGGEVTTFGDSGSASRFFYSAKADAADRHGSKHPTVKPVDLMAYYARLITPPGGTVLDPFAGSGSTGFAAMREGFRSILIEREEEYVADIQRRIAWAKGEGRLTAQERAKRPDKPPAGLPLFGDETS